MKKDWKASLREELLTSETTFRHDLSFVPVSSIAGQYYCEVKVDHEYVRGEIPTEEKEVGTDVLTHQKWSGANYIDNVLQMVSAGSSATSSIGKDSTEHSF